MKKLISLIVASLLIPSLILAGGGIGGGPIGAGGQVGGVGTPGGAVGSVQCNVTGVFGACTNLGDIVYALPNANTSGNAGTATALAANGANCAAGQAPLGVNASGAAEGCFAVQPYDIDFTSLAAGISGWTFGLGNGSGFRAAQSGDALPNGVTVTTQSQADNSTKPASTAYVDTGLGTKIGLSGTMTDEQLLCGENTDGTTKAKSCGAKITYTEPAGSQTLCRTGAGTTGACTNPVKLASFAWDGGGSAVTTGATSTRCVAIPDVSVVTGWTMVVNGDPGAGGTIVTLAKDSLADTLTAGALPTTDMDASAPPTVPDDEVVANSTTLTGWVTAVASNDIICATVDTAAVSTWISLTIYGTR